MERMYVTKSGTSIFRLTSARCNVFIVVRGGRAVIVDAGMPSDRTLIAWSIRKHRVRPEAVVLTHTHFDHAANSAWLMREYGTSVIVHTAEKESLARGDTPIPEGTLLFTRWLVKAGRRLPSWFKYEPCIADIIVEDDYSLSRFGLNGRVIHTPGHCSGEVAVIIDDETALTGDTLLGVIPGHIFPPFADNTTLLLKSWEKLLRTQCTLFIPGHGRPVGRDVLERSLKKRERNISD